jgi:hypothetical protein
MARRRDGDFPPDILSAGEVVDRILVIGLANVDADRLLTFVVRRTKRDNLVLVSNQPIIR